MTFQDAVRVCLQQKYAAFTGRARRSEFWFFALFRIVVGIVANILDAILHTTTSSGTGIIGYLVGLALLVPGLAVGARRLHDTGRSGWWQLLAFIPIVGWIILIVWFVQDSKPEPNVHGPSPKAQLGYGGPAPYGGYGTPPQ